MPHDVWAHFTDVKYITHKCTQAGSSHVSGSPGGFSLADVIRKVNDELWSTSFSSAFLIGCVPTALRCGWILQTDQPWTQPRFKQSRKTDMKSTSVCGCTYHWGVPESALCAHRAQMWGSSARAHAHWKYFYRSTAWLGRSVKSPLNIDFVFTIFLTERWSPLPGLMVHPLPHWTGEFCPLHLHFSRWPPKRLSWHRSLGLNSVEFSFLTYLWHWSIYDPFDPKLKRLLFQFIPNPELSWLIYSNYSGCLRKVQCLLWDTLPVLWGVCWAEFKCSWCFGRSEPEISLLKISQMRAT